MRIVVEHAALGDLPAVTRMEVRLFPEDHRYPRDAEVYASMLLTHSGRLAGFVILHLTRVGFDKCLFLARMGVSRPYRGNGWSVRLINHAVEDARRNEGAWPVYTYVLDDNAASLNSLIKAGFRVFVPHGVRRRRGFVWMRLP